MPLKSLTVFRGTSEARAHTVNWWIGDAGPYGTLEAILQELLDEHFPSPPVK